MPVKDTPQILHAKAVRSLASEVSIITYIIHIFYNVDSTYFINS